MTTIECQIMDLADDIAYSTYDLEDCMISHITYRLDLISLDDNFADVIAQQTTENLKAYGYDYKLTAADISLTFMKLFEHLIRFSPVIKRPT